MLMNSLNLSLTLFPGHPIDVKVPRGIAVLNKVCIPEKINLHNINQLS